ncbi:hypothetical protein MTR67_026928 [Solanum verrucosum]|uniref:Reverse transcriptase domain-containing protein n=1 Tax=Solanum verrucosum TaxID=315347 RepID=A0AAF0R3U4_SOLVR|nr:hypothetical protein MTR67_026928 [Solanum verrucosum]
MKGVMRFGKKGKLSPRYIDPYRISKSIGNVAYELELLIKDNLSYEEIPVKILDRQVHKLRTKEVASIKVDELQERIMEEAHSSRYSIHLCSTKIYRDLREVYWWSSMKRQHDLICVIVDYMTKSYHFLSTDGQPERIIQTLENMFRACVIDFKGNWDDHLPFIEFAYNNSYHSSIYMALYKVFYGRRCRSTIGWFEVGEAELIGPGLVHQAMKKVKIIQERLKIAQSH